MWFAPALTLVTQQLLLETSPAEQTAGQLSELLQAADGQTSEPLQAAGHTSLLP